MEQVSEAKAATLKTYKAAQSVRNEIGDELRAAKDEVERLSIKFEEAELARHEARELWMSTP